MVEDKIVYVDIEVGGWHRKAPIIEVAAVAVLVDFTFTSEHNNWSSSLASGHVGSAK